MSASTEELGHAESGKSNFQLANLQTRTSGSNTPNVLTKSDDPETSRFSNRIWPVSGQIQRYRTLPSYSRQGYVHTSMAIGILNELEHEHDTDW